MIDENSGKVTRHFYNAPHPPKGPSAKNYMYLSSLGPYAERSEEIRLV